MARIGSPNGLFPRRCRRLPLTRLRRQPLPARRAGGASSTPRRPAQVARSQAWRGNAPPGQAVQDGVR